ncbi:MAG TPA: hypothetical protein VHZ96_26385 [Frankiaceae bacterium]|nr:hypothetical protein [Frankiaceae bacterium]
MTAVWIVLAVIGWCCVALLLAALASGRLDDNLADDPSPTPLYDRLADDLGIRPHVVFTCGDETDIVQAVRLGDGTLGYVNGYRRRPLTVVHLPGQGAR